jgi:hypothetical protein
MAQAKVSSKTIRVPLTDGNDNPSLLLSRSALAFRRPATENSFLSSQLRAGMVVLTGLSRADAQTTQGLSRDSNQSGEGSAAL